MSKSQSKDRLIQNAVSARGAKSGSRKLSDHFLEAFYQQVPIDDLTGWKAEDLSTVADSICTFGAERKAGTQKLRVFNPEQKRDGWNTPYTIIQIVNDDMPFIIDSISSDLAFQGLNIEVLFHPILNVSRSKDGKLQDIHSGKVAGPGQSTESFVHIQLEQMLSPEACRKLAQTLDETLSDVRAATSDWRKMTAKIDQVISDESTWSRGHDKGDVREARDFLNYLKANNFTFLGYRAYKFAGNKTGLHSEIDKGSDLGVLRNDKPLHFGQGIDSPEVGAMRESRWPVMVSKLIDQYASVHRRVPMDAITIKITDKDGKPVGMHLFVGLFTSSTYSCRTSEVPVVRHKVMETIERAGFIKGSHDAKALEHILEKMPRDELFQVSSDDLYILSLGILRLQAKHRVALFTHMDPMRQHMSCLIYVPRDRYTTKFVRQAGKILEETVKGKVANYFTTLDDSPLARLLFTVKLDRKGENNYDHAALETRLTELGREWDERLKQQLVNAFGKIKGAELAFSYGRAFGSSYHESIDIGNAVHDIRQLEALVKGDQDIRVEFYRLQNAQPGDMRLKVYHKKNPVPLSDILPVLENMGLRSMSEIPFQVKPHGYDGDIWIHDFGLRGGADVSLDRAKENVEETFLKVWQGDAENDGLNQLVLRANLSWHEVNILRTYSSYMRQARFPYSRVYVEQVMNAYPDLASELVTLFTTLHDPKNAAKAESKGKAVGEKIIEMLQQVQKLDHDRILRNFKNLIEKTLRTNYYQLNNDGAHKSLLAVKLNSKEILDLPLPRPHVEIFVYSARVEAIHLRGGEIARGGIRWSDRADDFRTEILGLMKSQMVKNTVIVPVGAKGGFIVKQPPKTGGREAYQAEGIECYKIFVQALLDLTDNNVKGKIVRPKDVICHDGIDPYLVVAADKGTATFSDIANSLSLKSNFWLGDAFASGGSAGYDHKKMAITAKGGWESVKRHFREMGKDIQKEPFTLVGVGDMAGDVFGNALLLSKQTKMIAVFNHVHIFCDPNPDIEKSFAERQRLFKARGGWDAYDKSVLSQGGAIFERSAKVLKLSPQIRKSLDIDASEVTPDELMRAILKANVEMIWFGGIGTFVKSVRQSQTDADDKSNDAVRIDAREIRAKVVGEGANLGTTQLSRVEYARLGGRINTDFIDNSAGVDCSDHEVNIKILLNDVMGKTKMTIEQRDKLLVEMTADVAALVLKDNYQQTQALSLQLLRAKDDLGLHQHLIRDLEKSGLIKRSLEGLPDDESIARMTKEGLGLTRPELAVLTSWSKIIIYNQILASNIPDDPAVEGLLFDYFPAALHKYAAEIKSHKLKREIIATQIVNILVNRMGPVFVQSRSAKTGKSAAEVVKAFLVVMEAYDLQSIWQKIEALDNKVQSGVQLSALHETFLVVKRAVTWFLRFTGEEVKIAAEIEAFKPGVEQLRKSIRQMVPEDIRNAMLETERQLTELGMPAALASEISAIKLFSSASDIVSITRKSGDDIQEIAGAYFTVGERLGLDWLRLQASAIVPANSWQARVIGGLMDDYYIYQASLTAAIFAATKKDTKVDKKLVEDWFMRRGDVTTKIINIVAEVKSQPKVELEMLVLAGQRIGQMVHTLR